VTVDSFNGSYVYINKQTWFQLGLTIDYSGWNRKDKARYWKLNDMRKQMGWFECPLVPLNPLFSYNSSDRWIEGFNNTWPFGCSLQVLKRSAYDNPFRKCTISIKYVFLIIKKLSIVLF
jgi:hypothetical protein